MKNLLAELAEKLKAEGLNSEAAEVGRLLKRTCCGKSVKQRLGDLRAKFVSAGLTEESEVVGSLLINAKDKSERQKIRDKYYDSNAGHYKGGKGKRFDNCVKEKMELYEAGIQKLRVGKGKTAHDAAEALCAAMSHRSYGSLTMNDVIILQAYEKENPDCVVTASDLIQSGLFRVAFQKGEKMEQASPSKMAESLKEFSKKSKPTKEDWENYRKRYKPSVSPADAAALKKMLGFEIDTTK